MIRPIPTAADQARLAEIARLVIAARGILEEAATILREAGFGGADGPEGTDIGPDEATAYQNEWKRLTLFIDDAPVLAYHYFCQSEWTGGYLHAPGNDQQSVMRWPPSFGAPVPEVK